jgi:hypothetical protein
MAINNPFNTTVMPVKFRWILAIIMVINLITLCVWYVFVGTSLPAVAKRTVVSQFFYSREYFFVNGLLFKLFDFKKSSSPRFPQSEKSVVMA